VTISAAAGRVLGCLVEKQLTTPQQYPLTLNALSAACNQATNREPVMDLADHEVQGALDELKADRLVRFVLPSHGKSVTRYRHVLDEAHGLDGARVALLAVLLLRGPQTVGELRTRTSRMAEYDSTAAVQVELEVLVNQPEPLARLLPRRPGQKEDRWQQLVAEEQAGSGSVMAAPDRWDESGNDDQRELQAGGYHDAGPGEGRPRAIVHRDDGRLEALRSEVEGLRAEVAELSRSLQDLRASLGE
jgi:uncharacterized protein YceH (UPF0502 family)